MEQKVLLTYRSLHILNILQDGMCMNSEELADLCGVSSKTMRSNMNQLVRDMEDSGGEIVIKKGQGYELKVYNLRRYDTFLRKAYEALNHYMPDFPEERVLYMLFHMLDQKVMYRSQLMDFFVINAATLNKHLKRLTEILDAYRLKLVTEKNEKGICYRIEGREFDLRLCLIYRSMWYGAPILAGMGVDYKELLLLNRALLDIIRDGALLVKKFLFKDLLMTTYITVLRVRMGHLCECPQDMDKDAILNGSLIRPYVDRIAQWIADNLDVKLTEGDLYFLQIMFAAKSEYGEYIINRNIPIPEEIINLSRSCEKELPVKLRLFFYNSGYRRYEIRRALVPLYIRLRNGIYVFSPRLRRIKVDLPIAYQHIVNMLDSLNQVGKIPLCEEEVCALAQLLDYHIKVGDTYM